MHRPPRRTVEVPGSPAPGARAPDAPGARYARRVTSAPIALAGGSWVFLAFLVVFFLAIVYGYFTRTGGVDGGPGPERPSDHAHGQPPPDARAADG